MNSVLQRRLAEELARRRDQQLYRRRRSVEALGDARVRIDGRPCRNFSSNDYLGLAADPALREAMQRALAEVPAGSGAAHLITGHGPEHAALEEELAELVQRPRALLFSTGYMANVGTINALIQPGDLVLQDRLNHASLLDGGWLSRGRMERYKHLDLADLDARLAASEAEHRLVVSDSVFSMDGEIAPLAELAALCERRNATLMVDDAHGFGVLGPRGGGTVLAAGLGTDQVPVYVGTLGKAMGTFGAFVAGSEELIEYLIQRARTYVYTTALPPAVAAATRAALRMSRQQTWRQAHLNSLIERFQQGLTRAGITPPASQTAVQPLIVGEAGLTLQLATTLEAEGFLITPIRPPTVPEGTARLRITLSAAHSEADVDALVSALVRHLPAELRPAEASVR